MSRASVFAFLAVCFFAPAARAKDRDRRKPRNVSIGLLAGVEAIDLGAAPLSLSTRSGKTFAMNAAELGRFAALPIELRARGNVGPFRLGPLVALGPGFVPSVVDPASHLQTYGAALVADFGLVFGVALPRWRCLQPELELVGGARLVSVSLFHDDAVHAKGVAHVATVGQPLVEPRAGLDVWLGAHATLSVWAWLNAGRPDEPGVGLALAYHAFPFAARAR